MKFIHLTDPHLVVPGRRLYGLDPAKRLALAIEDINKNHRDAEFVAITGDLTHWGETDAYELLAHVLSDLTIPCHLVLGNHDHRDRCLEVFPDIPIDTNGFVQYVVDTSQGRFLVLDTTDPGQTDGHLCAHRLQWIQARLAEHSGPFYLLLHHPPFDSGLELMDEIKLNNPEDFWAILSPYRDQIRHIFFGHLHRPVSGSWRGVPMSTVWSTNHHVEFIFGPVDKLTGTLGQPAYGVVFIDEQCVTVHTHQFLSQDRRYIFSDTHERDTGAARDPWVVDPSEATS